jgi:hypothetical protein
LTSNRTINLARDATTATESVYDTIIENMGYKTTASDNEYTLSYSPFFGRSRYTVMVDGPSIYTVKKHISSSPIGSITFWIKIVGETCMIRRHYGSKDLATNYTISKTEGDWALGCCHDGVLEKLKGYTQHMLDMDACQAYDAGFFIMKLEALEDEEWVKLDRM